MIFYIEQIPIELREDEYGVRLKTFNDELLLPGQSIAATEELITKNFAFVAAFYSKNAAGIVPVEELYEVCLKIVIHYFYLYNLWRSMYEKEKNRNLLFLEKDFTHPNTYDTIIRYFKIKNPTNYIDQCTAMLGIQKNAFLQYEADREAFNRHI